MRKLGYAVAVGAGIAAASAAAIPPAYESRLPPEQQEGAVAWRSGGWEKEEALALKRAAQEYPLQLVFEEKGGSTLAYVPVTIHDLDGRVVFEGVSRGPIFLARLPQGRYVVTAKWEDWTFSREVEIGEERERVVFAWSRRTPQASPPVA